MIDVQMRTFLLEFPGVTAEVGQRIFPDPLPQGATLPAIAYSDISDVGDHTGPEGAGAYRRIRIQLAHWSQTREGATRLAETVRCVMDGYKGSWSGTAIGAVLRKNSMTHQDAETGLWRTLSDYVIHVTG